MRNVVTASGIALAIVVAVMAYGLMHDASSGRVIVALVAVAVAALFK